MSIGKDYTYPRETTEYVFLDEVLANGFTPEAAQYQLTRGLARPKAVLWNDLEIVDGRFAFRLLVIEPGPYNVFIRVPSHPETVIEAGKIEVT